MSEKKLSYRVAEKIFETENFASSLGIEYIDIDDGYAKVKMEINENHKNGNNTCHGGAIFTLADTAFALACNSRNVVSVGQFCDISYVKPAFIGDTLVASATEKYLSGRTGIYDILVTNQKFETIALFQGKSRALNAAVLDEEEVS